MGEDVEYIAGADPEGMVEAGFKVMQDVPSDCGKVTQAIANALNNAVSVLQGACRHTVNNGGGCDFFWALETDIADMSNASVALIAVISMADEANCLKDTLTRDVYRSAKAQLDSVRHFLLNGQDAAVTERVQLAFERLTDWQDELADLGGTLVDRALLFPSDVSYIFNCPQPCTYCSRDHNSVWKGREEYKFKCHLDGRHKDSPPDRGLDKISCERPRRRMTRPWQFKTWCEVSDWKIQRYQQARIAASITCGSFSILEALKTGQDMPDGVMQTCMLVEQRMSVSIEALRRYRAFVEVLANDGGIPEALLHAFSLYLSSSTAEGLAGLRASAEGRPTTDKLFDQLVNGSNYTFLLPGVIPGIPCDPPAGDAGALLMGVFRAVSVATAGPLAGLAATWPIVMFTAFWYSIIGVIATQLGLAVLFLPHTWVGLILVPLIRSMWVPAAQASMRRAHNKHAKPTKACPAGLVFLGSQRTPICVKAMDYGDAQRLDCPDDPEGFGATVTCESEYNGGGAPIVRDNFC